MGVGYFGVCDTELTCGEADACDFDFFIYRGEVCCLLCDFGTYLSVG